MPAAPKISLKTILNYFFVLDMKTIVLFCRMAHTHEDVMISCLLVCLFINFW